MGCVDDDGVGTGLNEGLHAVKRVDGHTHTCGYAQTAFLVLASHGLVLGLGNVLIGDETHEAVVAVYNGQFLNLVVLQNVGSSSKVGLYVCGDEILFCHHVVDELVEVTLKTQVTVGNDAHKVVVVVNNRNAADVILGHHGERIFNGASTANGHGIVDHSVLGTFHDCHLARLFLYRHVLVDHADTSLARYGDSHCRFCHGVHGCCHERHVKINVTREFCFQLYRFRQYL